MAITNINTETGVRYGVINANDVPYLYDAIITNGTDETFEAYKRDLVTQVASLLTEHGQRNAESTAADIVDNYEWDDYQSDESNYSYDDGKGNQFLLSYLGGAPLIWVVKSTRTANVYSLCSPCVPNAGDLDSGETSDGNGYECYGVPEEYQGKDD